MIADSLPWGLDAAAQQLADEVIRALPVTIATVAVWDQPTSSLTVKAVGAPRSLASTAVTPGTRLQLKAAPSHRLVLERRGPVCFDQESDGMSPEEMSSTLAPGLRSVCLLPILLGDEPVGVLALGEARSRQRAPFTEDRRQRWMRALEEFLATSSQSWQAARLRRQIRALSLLVQTIRQAFHARTHQELLACLSARLADWLGAPVRGLLLVRGPTGAMSVEATWELDEAGIDPGQLLLSITRTRERRTGSVSVMSVSEDPLDPLHGTASVDGPWTRVCLTLLHPDGLAGIVCLYVQEELYLAPWEIEMLRWLGEVAAACLRSARVLHEAQSEGEWLRRLAWELSTVHPRTVVDHALAGVSTLLGAELPVRLARLRGEIALEEEEWRRLADGAARVVTELIAQLRAAGDAEDVDRSTVDVNVLLRRAVDIARACVGQQTRDCGIPLELELQPASKAVAISSSVAVVGALAHAIANAVEALPRGGRIVVRAEQDGSEVVISVADTGVGVAPEHREAAFEPLFSTKGQPHLGLGLSVMRSAAARHGGDVRLLPGAAGGTVVELRLPAEGGEAGALARARGG